MGIQKNRKPMIAPNADGVMTSTTLNGLNRTSGEQDTGLTDVFGDKIYQKTLTITAGPNNSIVSIPHGIVGLKRLEDISGFIDDGVTWRGITNPEAISAQTLHFALTTTDLALQSGTGGDYSAFSGSATLQYTKA